MGMEEEKKQIMLGGPMALTNVFYYFIPLVSVMVAGHLGDLQLAASTLANSWASVTGFALMIGLSGALETLCGQEFGAQCYKLLGIDLQASCIITFLFSIIISIFWWHTKPILIWLHQSPEISHETAIYMRYLIPGLFAYGPLQNILRFLQAQSVVFPLVFCSFVSLLLHIPLVYALVNFTTLGYIGAPLATSIAFWLSLLMLVVYVNTDKKFEQTWTGVSKESFRRVWSTLKLALPSAAMVCLEESAFELLVLLAGLLRNPETTTSIIAMSVNTETVTFNFCYGLSAAASTRVANELGAMRSNQAKKAMRVSLKLSILLAVALTVALKLGHDTWATLFSDDNAIIQGFASMTPLLCVSIFLDSVQAILSGVCRGCGWQYLVMFVNFCAFYGIGMPVTWFLSFHNDFGTQGLWIGLICGLGSQSIILLLLTNLKKWSALEFPTEDNEENIGLLQMVQYN